MATTTTQTQTWTSTLQVRLTTRTETPIPPTPIVIPTNVTRYNLSQILNHLLENPAPIPYSFLVNGEYLPPTTLEEYISERQVSREEVLEIEYVRSNLPPKLEGEWSQEDWVGGVSVVDRGVLSGGYDGLVRVWDWSGNVLAKGRHADGALRPVKCVKWAEDNVVVSGSMDGSVRVWKVREQKLSVILEGKGHSASVDSLDIGDGKVVSASADGTVRLWSTDPSEGDSIDEPAKRKKRRTEVSHPLKVRPH
jgi:ribosome biogenesis protein